MACYKLCSVYEFQHTVQLVNNFGKIAQQLPFVISHVFFSSATTLYYFSLFKLEWGVLLMPTCQSDLCLIRTKKCNLYIITSCCKSQLSASNYCIKRTPRVIAHCAPSIVVADLHTTLTGSSASLKSDSSSGTSYKVQMTSANMICKCVNKSRMKLESIQTRVII